MRTAILTADWPATKPGPEPHQLALFQTGRSAPPVSRDGGADRDPPHNRTDTSCEAARRIKRYAPTQELAVLHFVIDRGDHGATNEEIALGLALRTQSETARCNGLAKRGLVRDSGQRRATSSGRQAIVWTATRTAATEATVQEFSR
jgi:hypothetical protein